MRNSHILDECVDEWIAEAELNDVVTTVLKKQFEVMLDKAKLYKSLYMSLKNNTKIQVDYTTKTKNFHLVFTINFAIFNINYTKLLTIRTSKYIIIFNYSFL